MPVNDIRKNVKSVCVISSVLKLCVIFLEFVTANTLAHAVTAAIGGDIEAVTRQAAIVLGIVLILTVTRLCGQTALKKVELRALNRCKLDFLGRVLSGSLSRLADVDHGQLLENLEDDINASADRYIKLFPAMIAGVITAAVYILYLLRQSLPVAATLLGISLLQLLPSVIVKKYMQINYDDCRDIEAKITDQVVEAVSGFEVIKLYGLKGWWQGRMAALHKDYLIVGNRSEATATAQISMDKLQSAVTNGHWCGGKRPQCGASAASLS